MVWGYGCEKLSWTGGEAGAFDCLPMGLANNDRTRNGSAIPAGIVLVFGCENGNANPSGGKLGTSRCRPLARVSCQRLSHLHHELLSLAFPLLSRRHMKITLLRLLAIIIVAGCIVSCASQNDQSTTTTSTKKSTNGLANALH